MCVCIVSQRQTISLYVELRLNADSCLYIQAGSRSAQCTRNSVALLVKFFFRYLCTHVLRLVDCVWVGVYTLPLVISLAAYDCSHVQQNDDDGICLMTPWIGGIND